MSDTAELQSLKQLLNEATNLSLNYVLRRWILVEAGPDPECESIVAEGETLQALLKNYGWEDTRYFVELVWNREFHFVPYGKQYDTLNSAIAFAKSMENSGDGAQVKKTRVLDSDGKVVWVCGRRVTGC